MTRPFARASTLPLLAIAALLVASAAAASWFAGLRPSGAPGAGGREAGSASGAILSESPAATALSDSAVVARAESGVSAAGLPEVGRPAPDFTLPDLDGRRVRLSDLRGKAVLINFWATWCPPCREEMPQIEAFYRRYRDRTEVLGIDVGESAEQVRAFLDNNPYSWHFLLDTNFQVTDRYRVFAIPTSYFIDKDGIIRGLYMGAVNAERIRALARQAGVDVD